MFFNRKLHQMLSLILQELQNVNATVDSLSNEITQLTAAVTAEQTVNQSAITLINGFAAQLQAAVAAATAAGATPDQLAALNGLQTQITTSTAALAAAVSANTPPPPPPTPAVAPPSA